MANNTIFKLKKSSVPGRVPDSSDLQYGELAINYADGKLYYKTDFNAIEAFTDDKGQDHYERADFDSDFASKTTDDLSVGSINQYYLTALFDSDFALKTTDDLIEGSNKYYLTSLFDSDFALKTTDDLVEGINKYYSTTLFNTDFAAKTSDDLTEGTTSLYYTTFRHDSDFDAKLAAATTDDLTEGVNNLYYTTARVDSDFDARLAIKSTSDITEGSNLYYTVARADSDFDIRLATKTTSDLAEGSNLYYTALRHDSDFDARLTGTAGINISAGVVSLDSAHTRGLFSASGDLQYNSSTGEFSFVGGAVYTSTTFDSDFNVKTTDQLSEGFTNLYYSSSRVDSDFDARLDTKSTTDLSEGSNLYYTAARVDSDFDARLTSKSTTDVTEGSNLYYTAARVDSDFDARLDTKSTSDITEGSNLYYTTARADSDFDDRLTTKSTSDVSEGSNLYYTTARADSDAKNALTGGTGITYTASTGTIDIANTGVSPDVYGSASSVPVLTINAQGQIDSAGTVPVAGVSSTTYDSASATFTINTADGGSFATSFGNGSSNSVTFSDVTLTAGSVVHDIASAVNADSAGPVPINSTAHNSNITSLEYLIQAYDGTSGASQVSKVLVTFDTTNVATTEYGVVYTGDSDLGTFSARENSGSIDLMFTRRPSNTIQIKATKTVIT